MIRFAGNRDIPAITGIATRFFAKADHRGAPRQFSPDAFSAYLGRLLETPGAAILVSDKGQGPVAFIAAMLTPSPYSGELIAIKLQWCVDPETGRGEGLKLARRAVRWATDGGATEIFAASMTDAGATILEHLGFTAFEVNLSKVLP